MDIQAIMKAVQAAKEELGVDGIDVSVNSLDGKPYFSAVVSEESIDLFESFRFFPHNIETLDADAVKGWAAEMQAKKQRLLSNKSEYLDAEEEERVA